MPGYQIAQVAAHCSSTFLYGLMKCSSANFPCVTANWLRSSRS